MDKDELALQIFGAFVHGFLTFGNVLGVFYNARKGNKWDAVIHGSAACYHVGSTWKHYKKVRSGHDPVLLLPKVS